MTIYSSAEVISLYDTKVRIERLLTAQRSQNLELSKHSTYAVISPLEELIMSYVQNCGGVYLWNLKSGSTCFESKPCHPNPVTLSTHNF
jgi:hypothetical protein